MYPWILPRLARNPHQLLFMGTFPIAFATIASGTALIAVPRFGQWARDLTWALWWIGVAITLATVVGVPVSIPPSEIMTAAAGSPSQLAPSRGRVTQEPSLAPNARCGAFLLKPAVMKVE
jgi:tellurite resistance protein TehA-like permease